jgi:hypothetical protein
VIFVRKVWKQINLYCFASHNTVSELKSDLRKKGTFCFIKSDFFPLMKYNNNQQSLTTLPMKQKSKLLASLLGSVREPGFTEKCVLLFLFMNSLV